MVPKVNTRVTPGKTVDVLVTDYGVAVNPRRWKLRQRLQDAGIPLRSIEELQQLAQKIVGVPEPIRYTDKVVGVVTYRDGSVMDLIRQVAD